MKRPRLLRGVIEIDGLILEATRTDERALSLWSAGSALVPLSDGRRLLVWPEARTVDVTTAPGLPVIRDGDGFRDHLNDGGRMSGVARVLIGGEQRDLTLGTRLDPASLLDLTAWEIHRPPPRAQQRADSTGAEPAAPTVAVAEPPTVSESRSILGVGEPDGRTRRAWSDLTRRSPDRARSASHAADSGWRRPGARGGAGNASGRLPTTDRLREALAKVSGGTARQERYLRDLRRRFRTGDIDEALRRAIPISAGSDDQRRSWRVPGRRSELTPFARRAPGGAGIPVDSGVDAQLRQHYNEAFAHLDRAGRTREAAFVLIDLLGQPDRGCTYLDEHGETALAAEIAAGRASNRGLAVRLLWKAGERERAITLATRDSAFATAISLCEASDDAAAARVLRRTWSSRLLRGGDVVGAYDALGTDDDPISSAARRRALEIGLAADGIAHARMTARAVREDHPEAARHVAALVAGVADENRQRRALDLIADDLAAPPTARYDRGATDPLVRALIALDGGGSKRVKTIVGRSGDTVLRADLPAPATGTRRSVQRTPSAPIVIDVDDRGIVPVASARALADGSVVAALEGVGIRIYRPDGRRRMDIALDASVLVTADHGGSFIAAQRLDARSARASLVHLADGGRQNLGEIPLGQHASTFDGSTWFVAEGETLWMLDILAGGPTALWAEAGFGGPIVALARSTTELAVASWRGQDGERLAADAFHFTLPGLVGHAVLRIGLHAPSELLPSGRVVASAVATDHTHAALLTADAARWHIECLPLAGREAVELLQIELSDTRPNLELDAGFLVYSDAAGRIERIDIKTGHRLSIRTTI